MTRPRMRAAVAALVLALALNAGAITAAAESRDSEASVLRTTEKEITILDPDEAQSIPSGLDPVQINVDGQVKKGWVESGDDRGEFAVFYGKMKDGEPGFYRYDLVERTVQRYTVSPETVTEDEYQKQVEKYNRLSEEYDDLNRENTLFKVITAAAVLSAIF